MDPEQLWEKMCIRDRAWSIVFLGKNTEVKMDSFKEIWNAVLTYCEEMCIRDRLH